MRKQRRLHKQEQQRRATIRQYVAVGAARRRAMLHDPSLRLARLEALLAPQRQQEQAALQRYRASIAYDDQRLPTATDYRRAYVPAAPGAGS